jgi:AraC-like DNA-binding protein
LFKYHSKISFPEYKKVIRIKESVLLIENDYLKKNTLDSLARKVGFISYNTFFVSFKDITGVNPIDYMKKN